MIFSDDAKPLTLDGLYIVAGNITVIRERLLDLVHLQLPFLCKVKPYPHLNNPADEFSSLCLTDYTWGDCGELEFFDLNGSQTLVRFYLPGPFELSELEKYERAIRQNLSRQRIGLWFYETIGWTPKVIEIFAEELFEHKVDRLRGIESLVVDRLGLSPYLLSYFQIQPTPQIGISQTSPDSPQPQAGISLPQRYIPQRPGGLSQIQPNDPNLPFGISQIEPEKSDQSVWISQLQQDDPQPQPGISQIMPDTSSAQDEMGWDIPREHPMNESNISFNREDQELLRLWTDGLTAKEIGIRTGKTGKTVTNRLSVLRSLYGEDNVPRRKEPTRKGLG